jgi:hypothetical protein
MEWLEINLAGLLARVEFISDNESLGLSGFPVVRVRRFETGKWRRGARNGVSLARALGMEPCWC